MVRTFRYRLKPTHAQERILLRWLDATRELYNAALEERREAWRRTQKPTHLYDQIRQLPDIRKARPDVAAVPTEFLRGALHRIDNAFNDFFGRCRRGDRPGYPRFRKARRWHTLFASGSERATQGKLFVAGGTRIAIPNLGKVKIKMHRPCEGRVLTTAITNVRGVWSVAFACEVTQPEALPKTGKDVGIDMGILTFAATSDGEMFPNPKPLRDAQLVLARTIRKMHKRKRGSRRWKQAVTSLSRSHAHVANIRRENHISVARSLVARNDVIYVEALTLAGLAAGHLAKHMRDAAFGNFLHWLHIKAESAGREVVEVDPSGTSQTCPDCGAVAKKTLKQREHICVCGLVCDRDVAAARVVLQRGRRSQRDAVLVKTRRRPAKIKSATTAGDR